MRPIIRNALIGLGISTVVFKMKSRGFFGITVDDNAGIMQLVMSGKFSGDIYQQWRDSNFRDEDIWKALMYGYEFKRAKVWKDLGFSVVDMIESGKVSIGPYQALEWRAKRFTVPEMVKQVEAYHLLQKQVPVQRN